MMIFTVSCNSNVALTKCSHEKVKAFYLGLQKITVYDINDCKTLISELNGFPKNTGNNDFKSFEWVSLDKAKEPYLSLVNDVSISIRATNNIKGKLFTENIFENIKSNSGNYYISGLYQPTLNVSSKEVNHYYYHYILDLEQTRIIEFDNRDMW